MAEQPRYQSEDEIKEQETMGTLKEEGGISFRQEANSESGETKSFVNILGIEVETYASQEDIKEIMEGVVLETSPVDQKILRTIAKCYTLRQPIMLEGDPGLGKTFWLKKFNKLIHGKDEPMLELVGSPRTSELEILGHWAPKGLKEKETEEYKAILADLMGKGELAQFQKKLNEELEVLNKKFSDGETTQEEFQAGFSEISQKYVDESKKMLLEASQMAKFSKSEAEWEFKQGALLQAYAGREGRGHILAVDEFSLIPANYQNIFLQMSGEKGGLSESVSFWGNSGKTNYKRGKDTWIAFAKNFTEKTVGSEVTLPMTDRLVWTAFTKKESEEKLDAFLDTGGGILSPEEAGLAADLNLEGIPVAPESNLDWKNVDNKSLAKQIFPVVKLLHKEFVALYEEVGDAIKTKKGERRRSQDMEFSIRNPARLYSYLDKFQIRDKETGFIDFSKTLSEAFEMYYVNHLVSEESRERAKKQFDNILGISVDDNALKKIRESEKTLKAGGKSLPPGVIMFEGQIMTRKEILSILSERASLTGDTKEKMERQSKEAQEREMIEARHIAEDAEERLLGNPNIPGDLKKMLRGEK